MKREQPSSDYDEGVAFYARKAGQHLVRVGVLQELLQAHLSDPSVPEPQSLLDCFDDGADPWGRLVARSRSRCSWS